MLDEKFVMEEEDSLRYYIGFYQLQLLRLLLLTFFPIFCSHLGIPIESEILDGF